MDEFQYLLTTPLVSIFIALLSFSFAWRWLTSSSTRKTKKSPPSPPTLPIIGNLHQLGQLPHRSLWNLSKKYGPLMLLHLGSKPTLVVSSADVAKQILKTHDLAFSDKPALTSLKKIFYDLNDVLTLPYGDQWRKLRSVWINSLNGYNAALDNGVRVRDEVMDAIIDEHLNKVPTAAQSETNSSTASSRHSFVDNMLSIYKGNSPGVSIDLVSVKALTLDVFTAATETSTTALVWIMTELIKHPKVMKKLQDEVRHVTKVERERVNLMGYEIQPDTMVLINAWAIGRDPSYWDEPEKYMPERFLNSSVDFKGFDFQFTPFGAGRRICPGIGFAEASIKYTIANLVHKFDWALPDGAKGEEIDVSEKPGITIGKKYPLIVVPTLSLSDA
ncbi:PREDICTED: cytochrome P450 71B9-like [Erythranthe guttata]|uniref:cytochrome P450 71B9-like n=1 Tax=Erythranthe guttata TaxID=4155 RepID=UPI00064D9CAD|nr:PREDICTED: cytochrome P450 71B9-like [Erythranthe guttata]|eukprot:XP_012855533.1 PREDICTED: cytochrome P450 71B9-like [Erythranthe guttata]